MNSQIDTNTFADSQRNNNDNMDCISAGDENPLSVPFASHPTVNREGLVDFMSLIDQLRRDNRQVFIKNLDQFRAKLDTLFASGPNSLEVVSDFDRTMTKFSHNGKMVPTCHGIMESDPELSQSVKNSFTDLKAKYFPIEIDHMKTEEEKIPFMMEWWTKAHNILVQEGIHQATLKKTVEESGVLFRDGVEMFLQRLDSLQIPLLIFSAGIGNVIDEVLRFFNVHFDNIKIVSNFMTFNPQGVLVGFQGDVIHVFNKNLRSVVHSHFYEDVCAKRANIILLGDSTGDVRMTEGVPDNTNVISIGFINEKADDLLPIYEDLYDVVLVNDNSFDFVNTLLDCTLHNYKQISEGVV